MKKTNKEIWKEYCNCSEKRKLEILGIWCDDFCARYTVDEKGNLIKI